MAARHAPALVVSMLALVSVLAPVGGKLAWRVFPADAGERAAYENTLPNPFIYIGLTRGFVSGGAFVLFTCEMASEAHRALCDEEHARLRLQGEPGFEVTSGLGFQYAKPEGFTA